MQGDEGRFGARQKALLVTALMEIDSSSSSSDSDESDEDDLLEDLVILYNMLVPAKDEEKSVLPQLTDYVERVVPGYSRITFKEHFRMFPETFDVVLSEIGPSLVRVNEGGGRLALPANKQLLLCLWFMATPDSYRSVATQFGINMESAYRVVRRVCYALHCKAPKFIQWPREAEAAGRVTEQFQRLKDFPGVIGAVDSSHIKIRAPKVGAASFINRKGFHSIILQAVCDARSVFTHCYAGPVGSVHDATVFRNSPLAGRLESPEEYFPNNSHLLGDAAYPLHSHVMVPFRDNGHLTRRQKNFNYCLSATRMCIERAFGLLKVRFRILLDCLPLTKIEIIPEFIIACCVLHNICMLQNDVFPCLVEPQREAAQGLDIYHAEDGSAKRNRLVNALPMRLEER